MAYSILLKNGSITKVQTLEQVHKIPKENINYIAEIDAGLIRFVNYQGKEKQLSVGKFSLSHAQLETRITFGTLVLHVVDKETSEIITHTNPEYELKQPLIPFIMDFMAKLAGYDSWKAYQKEIGQTVLLEHKKRDNLKSTLLVLGVIALIIIGPIGFATYKESKEKEQQENMIKEEFNKLIEIDNREIHKRLAESYPELFNPSRPLTTSELTQKIHLIDIYTPTRRYYQDLKEKYKDHPEIRGKY